MFYRKLFSIIFIKYGNRSSVRRSPFFFCVFTFWNSFWNGDFFCSELPLVKMVIIKDFLLHKVNKRYRIRVFFIWLISVAPNLRYSYLKMKIAFFLWKIDLKSKITLIGLQKIIHGLIATERAFYKDSRHVWHDPTQKSIKSRKSLKSRLSET